MKYIFFVLFLTFMISCGNTSSKMGEQKNAAVIKLNKDDSGKTIELSVGNIFEITLAANNTAGYQWEISSINTSVLEKISEEYIPDNASQNIVGSGGKFVGKFKAVNIGNSALEMVYHRTFEKDVAPVKKFNINVLVK